MNIEDYSKIERYGRRINRLVKTAVVSGVISACLYTYATKSVITAHKLDELYGISKTFDEYNKTKDSITDANNTLQYIVTSKELMNDTAIIKMANRRKDALDALIERKNSLETKLSQIQESSGYTKEYNKFSIYALVAQIPACVLIFSSLIAWIAYYDKKILIHKQNISKTLSENT